MRSQPRRAHALFPYASDLKTKVYQEEILVVLSEAVDIPAGEQKDEQAGKQLVPVYALEAGIYTVPSTSTALVYISKVDTTGLASSSGPSPARALSAAFVSHHLEQRPHGVARVRVHIFAKAQGQYLFPGSVDNKGKRVADDKALMRWWKTTVSRAVAPSAAAKDVKLFYLIPGLQYLESLPFVPTDFSPDAPKWTYGHPYNSLSSPLSTAKDGSYSLNDLIPAFPDDPKSRFIMSLTSSPIPSAGEEGDYDDVMNSLAHAPLVSHASSGAPTWRREEVEREREKERKRMVDGVLGGADEFWERMAWRQECCSGVLVGFFVIAYDAPEPQAAPAEITTVPGSLPHSVFVRVWSQIHNCDYTESALPKLAPAITKWSTDLATLTRSEGARDSSDFLESLIETHVQTAFEVQNAALPESKKRPAQEEPPKVNVLAVKKKKKPAANA